MKYLRLKKAGSRHCFYCNLEESAGSHSKEFMDVHKAKYAEPFETTEAAQKFKDEWDAEDDFEIVDNLEYE